MYKKIASILFIQIIFLGNCFSQDYWSVIQSPVSKALTNCYFLNSNTGWISGDSGTIIHTTNGGDDWIIQNTATSNNIEDIFFLNERLGWAVAFNVFPDSTGFLGTMILNTTNGGSSWNKSMFPDTNMFMKSVFYLDSLRGFLGGINASIVLTTNGGANWTYTDTDSTLLFILPVYKIKFFNNDLGYACGGFRDVAGLTWVTTNGGLNWKGTILAPEPFFDLTILNSQITICAGGDLEYGSSIAITVNQGVNWFYDTLGVFGLANGIDHRNPAEIWMAAGFSEKFISSSDTGKTWSPMETPDNTTIFDVDFTDTTYGYACGLNGTILKYDRTMSSVINEVAGLDADDFFLNQNYPNPFNPVTSLEFGISNSEFVSLKVYDVLGKEVRTLINEFKPAGHHKAVFDGKDLPGGIYFYRIIAGNFSQTRKMLLIK